MSTKDATTPRIEDAVRADLRVPPLLAPDDGVAPILKDWLAETVRKARTDRDELLPRIRSWRKTLSGKRPRPPVRTGASNLSVPLTMWAVTAIRARLVAGVLESDPLIAITPGPGRTDDDVSNVSVAKSLARFLGSEIRNKRGLDGATAINLMAAEMVSLGTSAMKVIPTPDDLRNVAPLEGDDTRVQVPVPGRVKWQHISWLDLIYVDGYGVDTQAMPLVGHEFERTWGDILRWAEIGYYDAAAIERVRGFFTDRMTTDPAAIRTHEVAELYLDYDINDDGVTESVLIDWHIKAEEILRVTWNPFPDGRRPVLIARFDLPPDLTCARGQGVAEKLEGPQEEADMIHNVAIEGGKRGAASLTVIKANTRAAEEIGDDAPMLPGDEIVTEDPTTDVVPVALGDANAAAALIGLEEHTRLYVSRLLGLDESRIGNVESGKRVPASLGLSTQREGRIVIKAAQTSLADVLTEATYLTIDLYKQRVPATALLNTLTPDEADALIESAFSIDDESIRSKFILRVNATDAATIQETRKNELFAINQFLFSFYDRLTQMTLTLANPQVPPQAKKPLMLIVQRMERGVEALLSTLESVPNPQELLVEVGEMQRALDEAIGTAQQQAPLAQIAQLIQGGGSGGGGTPQQ